MTRSRLAAASLSAAALGLAAVLVPTASLAEPIAETPAASAQVIWADAPEDFVFTPLNQGQIELADEWRWTAPLDSPTSSLADYGTFDENGFTANDSALVVFVHGVSAPIPGSEFEAFIENSETNAGAQVLTGVFYAEPGDESIALVAQTVDGFHGADTQWYKSGNVPLTTAELAVSLDENGEQVVGYFVIFPGQPTELPEPPAEPEEPPTEEPNVELLAAPEAADDATTFEDLLTAQNTDVALRAAAPAAAGIASFRVGDLTTYFTPQPTAALALSSASITVAQATTTGFTVTGSGFAPGETVTTGIGTGQMGDSLPNTFVADADGNVSGTIVLPSGWSAAGEYSIALIGASSGQFASSALVITGTAPVAVPVPGEATYTG
ncbi:hypothetical protein [Microbacterium sp. NPDC090003]|uniref:hypothetical protein n=1 Tax=Microbacterium sp. NPDC090003 TaxID=3364203 RepID=UPI00380E18C9